MTSSSQPSADDRISLAMVAHEWTRIGITGFGGPPAHIALLRRLVVDEEGWMEAQAFEDANAACGLLPGPASTQLAIFAAYRVAGAPGAVVGALGFIVPAVVLILALSVVFLGSAPPLWIRGGGAGAGAAVAIVAVQTAHGLIGPSYQRVRADRAQLVRIYMLVGAAAAVLVGGFVVVALLGCGLIEMALRRRVLPDLTSRTRCLGLLVPASMFTGGIGALAWTALKVGALSFGGGFVIVPLMQADAVHTYHWMTNAQFLNAVALGQAHGGALDRLDAGTRMSASPAAPITPGPVVATVAAVGYVAHGIDGGLLAAVVAFSPSLAFVLFGGARFERIRENQAARAFLAGAGPAAIGAILGAAITLAAALTQSWQFAVLAAAGVAMLALRRGVVQTLAGAGMVGVVAALAGAPLS